jgi:hypothetical protein
MKKIITISVLLSILFNSCSHKIGYVTEAPPIKPFFPQQVGVAIYGAPPLMLPQTKTIDEIEVSSQYFKISVPWVLDKSGKAEAIKNLIDEQFVTALDKTKRFTMMDKQFMLNIVKSEYETGIYVEGHGTKYDKEEKIDANDTSYSETKKITTVNTDSLKNSKIDTTTTTKTITPNSVKKRNENQGNISQFFGNFETDPDKYMRYINVIKQYTDGILRISITGYDDKNKSVDIDYKITPSSSDNYILYSGHGKIGFTEEKGSSSLSLNRDDIENIANDIAKSFPNPDLKTWTISQIHGKKITVDVGKNENIKQGMLGFVMKTDGDRIAYRAVFEVTEVFLNAFNAELKVEPYSKLKEKNVPEQNYPQYFSLLNSIKIGELVKMK